MQSRTTGRPLSTGRYWSESRSRTRLALSPQSSPPSPWHGSPVASSMRSPPSRRPPGALPTSSSQLSWAGSGAVKNSTWTANFPSPVKTTEVARVAAAVASIQQTALSAAATETSLRTGVSQVFVSLARRSLSLLQRQLRLIDDLEDKATHPAALADLFPLDHLTTRMRRHAEGLIILSGSVPGRGWTSPVPVIDVVRGAVAEVEDYK